MSINIYFVAPSAVSNLSVSASSTSISVSWQPGPGHREAFWVTLSREDALIQNLTFKSTVTSCTLDGLSPGTLYTVTVITEAVGKQQNAIKDIRTGDDALPPILWFVNLGKVCINSTLTNHKAAVTDPFHTAFIQTSFHMSGIAESVWFRKKNLVNKSQSCVLVKSLGQTKKPLSNYCLLLTGK